MNSITSMPILTEPENLSKAELLEKCKDQQETMILQEKALQSSIRQLGIMCTHAHSLSAQLGALVDSFDANVQEAVIQQLKTISDRRKAYQAAQKAMVH